MVFGDEVRGLTNEQLRRAPAIATIPTVEKASLNLAQSVLVFAYEVMLARGNGKAGQELPRGASADIKPIPADNSSNRNIQAAEASIQIETIAPDAELAEEKLLHLLRENARKLLLETGFLNKQKPDVILDELNRMLRRARPTRREAELLIGAVAQVSRNR